MPRHTGRPPAMTIEIEDCASLTILANPTPQCPHGKAWRETDAARIQDPAVLDRMCDEPECESTEYHPREGQCISLAIDRSFAGRNPLREAYLNALLLMGGQTAPEGAMQSVIDAVQSSVQAWSWTDSDGAVLPLPREDWGTVARHMEFLESVWILEAALRGEDPRLAYYRPPAIASGKDSAGG